MIFNIPNYMNNSTDIFDFLHWMVVFHSALFLYILFNAVSVLVLSYALLAIFRLFGWKWVDGTTRGFINRR